MDGAGKETAKWNKECAAETDEQVFYVNAEVIRDLWDMFLFCLLFIKFYLFSFSLRSLTQLQSIRLLNEV